MKIMINFCFKIFADTAEAGRAADILVRELNDRAAAVRTETREGADIALLTDPAICRDGYRIEDTFRCTSLIASGIRGHIFAIGMLLRKLEKDGCGVRLGDIAGSYAPDKRIRGHQIGYRTTPNTYDAWSYEDYRRYYLDMMFFGVNTVEHIP